MVEIFELFRLSSIIYEQALATTVDKVPINGIR